MELLAPISDPLDIVTKAYVDAGFMGAWSSGTTYRASQIVTYAGNLWAANTAPLVGATPGISGSWTKIGYVNDASGSGAGAMGSSDFTKLSNLYTPSNASGSTHVTNLNTIEQSGFYTTSSGATGNPHSSDSFYVQHIDLGSGVGIAGTQDAIQYAVGQTLPSRVYTRAANTGTWTQWAYKGEPRVAAYASSGIAFALATGWTTMVYQTKSYDYANEYNPGTGVFTPLVTGWYEFVAKVYFGSAPAGMRFALAVWNASAEVKRISDEYTSTTGDTLFGNTAKVQLTAGTAYRVRGISTGAVPTTINSGTSDPLCYLTISQ